MPREHCSLLCIAPETGKRWRAGIVIVCRQRRYDAALYYHDSQCSVLSRTLYGQTRYAHYGIIMASALVLLWRCRYIVIVIVTLNILMKRLRDVESV